MPSLTRDSTAALEGAAELEADSLIERFRPNKEGVAEAIAEVREAIDHRYHYVRLSRLIGLRRRTVSTAKRKYDKIAGRYQEAEKKLSSKDRMLAFVGDEIGFISTLAYLDYYRSLLADTLLGVGAKDVLEVGAGELNTIIPVAEKLGDRLGIAAALDISPNRLAVGRASDKKRIVSLSVAGNASELPFADKAFDVVFTSHCLEQSPELVTPGLGEFARVARSHILLAEPAYELAHELQRRRIRKIGYARGIPAAAERLGLKVVRHELLPVREFQNGTALTLIAL